MKENVEVTFPNLVGRLSDSLCEERAKTTLTSVAKSKTNVLTDGITYAYMFESKNSGSRGGVVIQIISDTETGFVPHCKEIEGGVEIHIAGDMEAIDLMETLKKVLANTTYGKVDSKGFRMDMFP